jgi:hypothetical protein
VHSSPPPQVQVTTETTRRLLPAVEGYTGGAVERSEESYERSGANWLLTGRRRCMSPARGSGHSGEEAVFPPFLSSFSPRVRALLWGGL